MDTHAHTGLWKYDVVPQFLESRNMQRVLYQENLEIGEERALEVSNNSASEHRTVINQVFKGRSLAG